MPKNIFQAIKYKLKANLKYRLKANLKYKLKSNLHFFLENKNTITFKKIKTPRVSIVLILWNQAELTLECLKSIFDSSFNNYQLIIVDNASTDRTKEVLDHIHGVTILQNQQNIGFLRAVNQAAAVSSGEFLLLLNNDAFLEEDALLHAVNAISSDQSIGAVGGKIILPDGTLQEAGSIIWQDGSCSGYLRGQDPECNESMFTREVDYCSGVFLLTRLELFRSLKGLDEEYAPAYYEETDYCVRLQEHGYKVIFEPKVIVKHFEFGSAPFNEWAFQQMQTNKKLFVQRCSNYLQNKYENNEVNILRARTSKNQKRILFFDDIVPQISKGSGFPRAVSIINTMVANGYFVTLYPMINASMNFNDAYKDISKNIEVILNHKLSNVADFLKSRLNYYDIVFISRPTNMHALSNILSKLGYPLSTKIIYDAEAIWATRTILYQENILGRHMPDKEKVSLLQEELHLAAIADTILAVSTLEANIFIENGYKNVYTLGHKISVNLTENDFDSRKNLLFVGRLNETESPNFDSILWFVQHVFALVATQIADIKLICVGLTNDSIRNAIYDVCPKNLRHLIDFVGEKASLDTDFNNARVFICPTRFAAGIPHKTHEAASKGLPIVSTELIAQQLNWKHNEELLFANDPKDFANYILLLYTDKTLWNKIRLQAAKKIHEEQSSAAFDTILLTSLNANSSTMKTNVTNILLDNPMKKYFFSTKLKRWVITKGRNFNAWIKKDMSF